MMSTCRDAAVEQRMRCSTQRHEREGIQNEFQACSPLTPEELSSMRGDVAIIF
jgi:hypothetical protein